MKKVRLTFKLNSDDTWSFFNEEKLEVGWLEKIKVGKWQHWCMFLKDECYLSPGCMDEVREFQKKIGSTKKNYAVNKK